MQVRSDEANQLFAKWISNMSDQPCYYHTIELRPQIHNCIHRVEEFCEFVFPQANLNYSINNPEFFWTRAILTWRNDTVADLNHHILQDLPCEEYLFESIKQADYDGGSGANTNAHELPTKFFNLLILRHYHLCSFVLKLALLSCSCEICITKMVFVTAQG